MKQTEVYFDNPVRIVALLNLAALCDRISGVCHQFTVDKVTGRYCYVRYSNPNEYGTEHPITAVYPVIPFAGVIGVVLNMTRCIGGDDLDSQAFDQLECHPELWKPMDGEGWRTTSEILASQSACWGIAGSILFAGFVYVHTMQGEPWRVNDSTGRDWESYCHKAWQTYR